MSEISGEAQFEALKRKRVDLVKDKVEAHSQGDLRENFGFAVKASLRARTCRHAHESETLP